MAQNARRKAGYTTYGNVAYAPGYDGAAVRPLPRGGEVLRPRPKARTDERERTLARPRVRVREQGAVSLFAVAGFLAVGVFAALVLLSFVRLTALSDESITLSKTLSGLKTEEARLLAKYELAYDLKSIEEKVTANGAMVKPRESQIIVIDLSAPDSVLFFSEEERTQGMAGLLRGVEKIGETLVEYFR